MTRTHEAGGTYIIPCFGMTLRDRQRAYYYGKLNEHFPGLRERYERAYRARYSCPVPNHQQLEREFTELCQELSIETAIPQYDSGGDAQMSLF